MKKEDLIKLGLTEEMATKVVENYGHMIPKGRFDEEVEEKNNLKSQLEERNKQLEERDKQLAELSKNNADNEELKKQIAQLQADNKAKEDEYNENISKLKLDNALDKALTGAGSKNNTALKALLNLENIKLDGENLIGLNEQLEAVKKDNDYLFESEEKEPGAPAGTTPKNAGDGTNPPAKMTLGSAIAAAYGNKN